jgi:hypothetical protein
VDKISPKKPVFLLVEKCPDYSYPLLLVLNFEEEKALFLGVSENGQRYDNPEWFDRIWRVVRQFFGWKGHVCHDINLKNWIPVCFFHFQHQNRNSV